MNSYRLYMMPQYTSFLIYFTQLCSKFPNDHTHWCNFMEHNLYGPHAIHCWNAFFLFTFSYSVWGLYCGPLFDLQRVTFFWTICCNLQSCRRLSVSSSFEFCVVSNQNRMIQSFQSRARNGSCDNIGVANSLLLHNISPASESAAKLVEHPNAIGRSIGRSGVRIPAQL